ncbi:MAG: hypothetical protein ACPGLV_19105 [Bacteroidia bacterium]
MRLWSILAVIVFLSIGSVQAQKKKKGVNSMNGLTEASVTRKKYNKQWIKLRSSDLPAFSTSIGFSGGPATINHSVSEIEQFGRSMLISPELTFNINPSKRLGFNFGLSYRSITYTYMTQNASFTNDTVSAVVNGDWRQIWGNVGVSLGFTYWGNIKKSILSCNGFGIVPAASTYFYWENGVTFAPALINEVYLRGSFNEFSNGEPSRSGNNGSEFVIMYNSQPRTEAMLFYYTKLGLRFQSSDGFATRIGPFFNLQLNYFQYSKKKFCRS